MFEATEHRVLPRSGVGSERIDLDDPTEAERLVRLAGKVETRGDLHPATAAPVDPVADVRRRVVAVELPGPVEVSVEVFLPAEHRSPGCHATGAVAQGAEHRPAIWVVGGLQPRIADGRAGEQEPGRRGDPAVVARGRWVGPAPGRPPIATPTLDGDDGEPDRGHRDLLGLPTAVGIGGGTSGAGWCTHGWPRAAPGDHPGAARRRSRSCSRTVSKPRQLSAAPRRRPARHW